MMQQNRFIGKALRAGAPGLLGLSLAFVGCNEDKTTSPTKATPTVMIMSPAKGSMAAASGFKVSVMKSDFTYGKIGDPNMDGAGHMHIYLDKPASSGTDYTAVITGGDTATVAGPLKAGPHYIIVALQKNDHSAYNIQDSVAFTVAAATDAPSFAFVTPAAGSTNGSSVTIKLSPMNFKVVAPGTNKAGEGHFHYFVDAGTYVPLADTVFTLDGLAVGEHTVRVTMQNSDHSDLNIEKSLKFWVGGGMPNFTIAYPMEGATVGTVTTLKLTSTNLKVSAPGDLKAGEGHFHYFVDGGAYNLLVDSSISFVDLAEGSHSVRVTLQDNKHADLGLERTVNFKVSKTKPSFTFAAPMEGATVGSSVTIRLAPSHFKVVAPSSNAVDGEGHFHYFVDGGAYNALADTVFTLNDLSVGDHMVRVTMQDNKHADLDAERTVKFKVSATEPSFKIVTPMNGDTVMSPVSITMKGKNFTVVAPGTVKANEGHYHYFIDGGAYNALADTTVSLTTLTAGPHTIKVTMQKSDHSDYGLEQWVSFIVK